MTMSCWLVSQRVGQQATIGWCAPAHMLVQNPFSLRCGRSVVQSQPKAFWNEHRLTNIDTWSECLRSHMVHLRNCPEGPEAKLEEL